MNELRRCKPLLGTYVEVLLKGECDDIELIQQSESAFSAMENVQACMSFHDDSSELSQINQLALQNDFELSEPMNYVLSQVDVFYKLSNGLFDPTVANQLVSLGDLPKPVYFDYRKYVGNWQDVEIKRNIIRFHKPLLIDLGGIAKGYAVDQAIDSVDQNIEIMINAGGDIRMSHWQDEKISIAYSHEGETKLFCVSMQAPAVASSASYYNREKSVIVNPLKRSTIDHRDTVSVFAETCMLADALTKIVWLSNDPKDVLNKLGAHACLTNDKKNIYIG